MEAYQQGIYEAFEELYPRYSRRVYGYLHKKLDDRAAVEDLFQAIFLKLHRSRSQYDPTLPFRAWLFTICRTTVIDYFRKQQRTPEIPTGEPLEKKGSASLQATPEPANQRLHSNVDLQGLSPQQQKAIQLRYEQDLPFEEIAKRLETSPANARQIISRAIRRLRKLLPGK